MGVCLKVKFRLKINKKKNKEKLIIKKEEYNKYISMAFSFTTFSI
jgi:hypothetical protein